MLNIQYVCDHADRGHTVSDGVAAGSAVRHTLTHTHTQECGDGTAQVPSVRVVTSLQEGVWGRACHQTPGVCQGVCVRVKRVYDGR